MPTRELAEAAKRLAEARGHRIADTEVYRIVLGLDDVPTVDPSAPTLGEWIETWLSGKADISPDTLAEYRYLLTTWVVRPHGDVPLPAVVDQDIVGQVLAAARKGLAPATIHKLHGRLHQVLRVAVPRWLATDPCAPIPGQRGAGLPRIQRHPAVYLSRADAGLILAACPATIRDVIALALGTGLRLGELLALRVGDVDLENSRPVIHIQRARKKSGKVGDPKSSAGTRPVDLSPGLAGLLAPHLAVTGHQRPATALVFPAPAGGMWDPRNFRRVWKRALVTAARCREHPPANEGGPMLPGTASGRLCRDHGGVRSDGKPCGKELAPGMTRCRWHMGPRRDAVSACDCPNRLHVVPRIHDTRHSHVDWLLDADWDLYDVQLRIGHEKLSTTFEMYGNRRRRPDSARVVALDEHLPAISG